MADLLGVAAICAACLSLCIRVLQLFWDRNGMTIEEGNARSARFTLPHSRACVHTSHDHGSACHSNCPTCYGRSERVAGPAQPVSSQVTTAMVEAAIKAWNVAEPVMQIVGVSYHRTFAEVITAALSKQQGDGSPQQASERGGEHV